MIVALALAMAPAPASSDRRAAMEQCAEAVITAQYPNAGMIDVTGTRFAWLSVERAGRGWRIIGSFSEPVAGKRAARRFTCTIRGDGPANVVFDAGITLPKRR